MTGRLVDMAFTLGGKQRVTLEINGDFREISLGCFKPYIPSRWSKGLYFLFRQTYTSGLFFHPA